VLQVDAPATEIMEHALLTQLPALNPEHPVMVVPKGQFLHVVAIPSEVPEQLTLYCPGVL